MEDDDAFCRLIYRFTVNKDDTEIPDGLTQTNERHDRASERRIAEIQQILNQMIFYVRNMST